MMGSRLWLLKSITVSMPYGTACTIGRAHSAPISNRTVGFSTVMYVTSVSGADSGTRTGIHRTNDRSLSCFMTGTVLRTRVQPSYDLVHPLRAPHQLFPQSFGLAHHKRRVGLEHVPGSLLDLAAQLARLPRHEAGDEPRVLGLRFDDAVYDRGVEGREQSGQHLE